MYWCDGRKELQNKRRIQVIEGHTEGGEYSSHICSNWKLKCAVLSRDYHVSYYYIMELVQL